MLTRGHKSEAVAWHSQNKKTPSNNSLASLEDQHAYDVLIHRSSCEAPDGYHTIVPSSE